MLFIYQKFISNFIEPPLINQGTKIVISFNENMIPRIRRYTDLLKVKIRNLEYVKDYKKKYVAIIVRQINYFKYEVEIIGTIT